MLLQVKNLASYFLLDEGVLKAIDDVSFSIFEKETLALVGESGCGKTIVALSLLNLIPSPGRVMSGQIHFNGEDVLLMGHERLRHLRGGEIGMVFQEPSSALNPVLTIGRQITEVLRVHRGLTRHEADREAVRLLGKTGIPQPETTSRAYPFQLSGGMRQRALIAIAVCAHPQLLIADEPTTALDAAIQAEIIELLRYLQQEYEMAILLITHDIGVVASLAHRALVMYTGKIVEAAYVPSLLRDPKHPYTQGLLRSIPRLGEGHKEPLRGISGSVPSFLDLPLGCTFHPRCSIADKLCRTEFPPLRDHENQRQCACFQVTHGDAK